ncbi:nuclear transport factor 2 family protein [Polaribacter gochangensis]|uniref:nuclear transport factor 2 family protein n=1 Tax=Polaribacter gochangensis TaxID=3252903 RepID=UPI003904964C
MKNIILFLFVTVLSFQVNAQTDKQLITKACMNYLEGFYEGNTDKLKASLKPTLHKFGFWKSEKTNKYGKASYMTFEGALKFAKNVEARKNYAKKGSPKIVEILDLMDKIAAVKVTAYWGTDYMFLAKQENGNWMIEQVIWQGPNT